MSKKIIKSGDYSLHIITSLSGVIIVKVYDRDTKEQIENSIFTEISDKLEIYLGQFTKKVEPILNYLNQN